jgi:uncharacterized membrane protein
MVRTTGNVGEHAAREVASWVPLLARLGFAAKGVVFLLVGWIALRAGMEAGSPEGARGALAALDDETGGRILLILIAAGLLCHVAWRFVQAFLDPEHHGDNDAKRIALRVLYALGGVIYLSLAFTAWQLGRGEGSGSDSGQGVWIQKILEQPYSAWLAMLSGIGVMIFGLHQLYQAWKGDIDQGMTATNARVLRGVRVLGRVGIAAQGAVLLPIGWFIFSAGREYRAEEAANMEEVLEMLGSGWLLMAVAVGLMAYGLHQIVTAIYRRIEQPG